MFFLDLYNGQKSWALSKDQQCDFYEKGVRPALSDLLGARAGGLPPSHAGGLFVAQGSNGQLSLPTLSLHEECIPYFADLLRQKLRENNIPWGENIVFLHQIRGVKEENSHAAMDGYGAEVAKDRFLRRHAIVPALLEEAVAYIDVGIEMSSNEKLCLCWWSDRHHKVVNEVAEIPLEHAVRITSIGSSKFTPDPTSHLPAASGFRVANGSQAAGPYQIVYMQAYLTDKGVTYHPEHGHFGKHISALQIINGKGGDFCGNLYNLYRSAMDHNVSACRLEVRVPIQFCEEVLVDVERVRIGRSLLKFDKETWW